MPHTLLLVLLVFAPFVLAQAQTLQDLRPTPLNPPVNGGKHEGRSILMSPRLRGEKGGWGVSPALDKRPIPQEAGHFIFRDAQGNPAKPITVWFYQPPGLSPAAPIVFVMHGIHRNARRYRDEWMPYARQYGFLLFAPEFAEDFYTETQYRYGNMFTHRGRPIPEAKWTFSAIEHLFDYIKQATKNQSATYFIYGHSAGGQFVHRLILFQPNARIQRAIAANPGVYALPDFAVKFPYGLQGSGLTPEKLQAAFARDFILLLGEQDIRTDDPDLPKTKEAKAQGKNRFERGWNFYRAARNVAVKFGARFHWQLETVAGAAHQNAQMAGAAAQLLFQ